MKYKMEPKVSVLIGLTEDNEIQIINSSYANLDYVFIIKEAGVIDYKNEKFPVEVGDVVLKLYAPTGKVNDRKIVIIPAKYAAAWVENMETDGDGIKISGCKSSDDCVVAEDEVPVTDVELSGIND